MSFFQELKTKAVELCISVAITLDNSDHQLPIDFEEVTVLESYTAPVRVNI